MLVFTYAYCLLRTTYSHGCQPHLYASYELPHMLLSFKNFALQAMWDISVGVKAKQTQMEEKQCKEKWIFQKKRKKDTKKIQLKLSLQKQLSIRFAGTVSNAASGEKHEVKKKHLSKNKINQKILQGLD